MSTKGCPRCSTSLETVDLGQYEGEYPAVVIDRCPSCQGVWYDAGELDQSDESVWTDVEATRYNERIGHPHAPCPSCDATLQAVSPDGWPEIVVDHCRSCRGFWLDAGELEAIQQMAARMDDEKRKDMPAPLRESTLNRGLLFLGLVLLADD